MTLPAPIAVTDLFPPPTVDDVRAILLAVLAVDENPITDWHSGAIFRTMYEWEAYVTQDLVANVLNGVIGNGYPDPDGDPASQDALTHGFYDTDREEATFAVQTVTLACDAAHGPYPIATGRQFVATDRSTYTGLAGGTLPNNGTLTLDVGANTPGAMRALVAALQDGLPGVVVQSAVVKVVMSVAQSGSDEESTAALLDRAQGQFEDLDADPGTQDRLEGWALAAGTSTTRTRVDPDTVYAGGAILTLANGSGGVSGGEVTTVQDYVNARTFDLVTAQTATNASVTAGNVLYPRDWTDEQLAEAQAAADAAWALVNATNQIGGLVTLDSLNKCVMDQGVFDFYPKTLNGSPIDLVLGAGQVPVPAGSLIAELTWNPY